jgi:hypothetical protein
MAEWVSRCRELKEEEESVCFIIRQCIQDVQYLLTDSGGFCLIPLVCHPEVGLLPPPTNPCPVQPLDLTALNINHNIIIIYQP